MPMDNLSQQDSQKNNQPNEELIIKETWSKLWASKNSQEVDNWDSLSEIVLATLLHECKLIKKETKRSFRIVEAGCGTGRICRELLHHNMDVACLDISPEALELAKAQIGDKAEYILGSILDMPKRENATSFDVVWNSGVMEHFSPSDQQKALREFALSLRKGEGFNSRVITLTPYSKSFLYRVGKIILEKLNKWPFGREIPVATLQDVCPSELILEKEYSTAFLALILDAYKWLPFLRTPSRQFFFFLMKIIGRNGLRRLDRMVSAIFGGYLLVSVFKKKNS